MIKLLMINNQNQIKNKIKQKAQQKGNSLKKLRKKNDYLFNLL